MNRLSRHQITEIFASLRGGAVPLRGMDAFAVGIEAHRDEIHNQLEQAEQGSGAIKFLRGDYGCGKTFMSRLAIQDALDRGFAASFVVVSDNDLHLHRFDQVYARVMAELGTSSCPRGAFGDILDRWIGVVEDRLIELGADEDAPDFDEQVRKTLNEELVAKTQGKAPQDFIRVLQTIFDLKQQGELADAGALLSWLSGSKGVAAGPKRAAGIKGDIESKDAFAYLRGVLEVVKLAGYKGLVIVIDEAETILRMRADTRHRSLNGIRQIHDAASSYPGLLWIFTGTPEFFDNRRGVAGLAPLHDRIRFLAEGQFVSLRQPQIQLVPFDKARLAAVAMRLRDLYPSQDRAVLEAKISDEFINKLVQTVTERFGGDVGIVPRQFLRIFVNHMDLVDEHAAYDPMEQLGGVEPSELSAEEQLAAGLGTPAPVDDDDGPVPVIEAW